MVRMIISNPNQDKYELTAEDLRIIYYELSNGLDRLNSMVEGKNTPYTNERAVNYEILLNKVEELSNIAILKEGLFED